MLNADCIPQMSLIHYGPIQTNSSQYWFTYLESLPMRWADHGVYYGSCGTIEHADFYSFDMTIPNMTYTNQVTNT